MIIVLGCVTVRNERLEEALKLSQAHVQRSRKEPGCISHEVFQDPEIPGRLMFVEKWSDQAALDEHFKVPASGEFVTAISAWALKAPSLSLFNAEAITG